MATDDDVDRWRALRDRFVTKGQPRRAVGPPSAADLDRFEAEAGIRLAAGYRGFVQAFGAGVLAVGRGWIRCLAPSCRNESFDLGHSLALQRSFAQTCFWVNPRIARLVVFASDLRGDRYGWDPEDITDPDGPEFGVYAWRHGDDETALKLTRTFEGFIRLYTNQTEFRTRQRARAGDQSASDPPFDFFRKASGEEIPGVQGQPLLKEFAPAERT